MVFLSTAFYLNIILQVNLDMTDSMRPGKLVRHMQNLSYTYDEYLICIGLGPSILSVICNNLSYSGPSYLSSPVFQICLANFLICMKALDIQDPRKNQNMFNIWNVILLLFLAVGGKNELFPFS